MTDELREQAVLFVLGQLEGAERSRFLDARRADPEIARLVEEYSAILGAVSLAAEERTPPARLRSAILEKARGKREPPSGTEPSPKSGEPIPLPKPRRVSSLLPWAAAAGFAILSGFLFLRVSELEQSSEELARISDPEGIRTAALAEVDPDFPGVSARVAWNGRANAGILELENLPSAPAGRDYQVWVFEEGQEAPVSAGLIDRAAPERFVFRPERQVGRAVAVAVSLEVAGGRPLPEGPVVLLGELSRG